MIYNILIRLEGSPGSPKMQNFSSKYQKTQEAFEHFIRSKIIIN